MIGLFNEQLFEHIWHHNIPFGKCVNETLVETVIRIGIARRRRRVQENSFRHLEAQLVSPSLEEH